MSTEEIVLHAQGAGVLPRESKAVGCIIARAKKLVEDLRDSRNAHPEGIGLAVPQIAVRSRVVVVRLGGGDSEREPGPPIPLINPEIVEARDRRKDFDGCLSLPGLYGETVRPHHLRVIGLNEDGRPFDRIFEGFDAVVVHHEIDHLDGVLYIDRAEGLEDLYRVRETEDGELVRVPLSRTSQGRTRNQFTLDLQDR